MQSNWFTHAYTELVEYSLLQQVDSTKPVCQIHDVILDYLKYCIPEEKQVY